MTNFIIAIIYTLGILINKLVNIYYNVEKNVLNTLNVFFLLFIWTFTLTENLNQYICFTITLLITLIGTGIFYFDQSKKKRNDTINETINKFDEIPTDIIPQYNDIIPNDFKKEWIGKTGKIIQNNEYDNNYLGIIEETSESIILYSENDQKLQPDDDFEITDLKNCKFYCKKIVKNIDV